MTHEQAIQERQNALIEKRCHMIEHRHLKSCQPLPGDKPAAVRMRPESECPNCSQTMTWFPRPKAYFCMACQETQ